MNNFDKERLALKYLQQYNIKDGDPHRDAIINAFCAGFQIANDKFEKLRNEIKKQDHLYLSTVADNLDSELKI